MRRLDLISSDLSAQLESAPAMRRKMIGLAAIRWVTSKLRLHCSFVGEAIRTLNAGSRPPRHLVSQLNDLRSRLDDEYFTLREAALEDQSAQKFREARAIAALLSMTRDTPDAVFESVYEAIYAVREEQRDEFVKYLTSELEGS